MRWSLVNEDNIVVNIIAHDGKSSIEPPDNLRLVSTNNWVSIGDNINKEKPPKPIEPTLEELKQRRNNMHKDNLALKGLYRIEKRLNPTLEFSDYLDTLEA